MSTPIAGLRYSYNALAGLWDAYGRPSLTAVIDLFTLEFTKPTAANTGCRIPREELTVHTGDMVVTVAGSTVSGYLILGRLIIRAANVTAEDCIVEAQGQPSSTVNVVDTTNSAARFFKPRFLTVRSVNPSIYINGIGPKSFTAYRCHIADVVDGGSISDSTGNDDDVIYEGCLIERLFYLTPDPTHASDNRTHNDGVQVQGGQANVRIQGCTILALDSPLSTNGGSTSGFAYAGVMLNTTPARTKSNVQILGNWIDGGGYSINGLGTDGGTIQIKRNKFGRRRSFRPIGANISLSTVWDIPLSGVDANRYEDNGALVASTDTFVSSGSTIRRYF